MLILLIYKKYQLDIKTFLSNYIVYIYYTEKIYILYFNKKYIYIYYPLLWHFKDYKLFIYFLGLRDWTGDFKASISAFKAWTAECSASRSLLSLSRSSIN